MTAFEEHLNFLQGELELHLSGRCLDSREDRAVVAAWFLNQIGIEEPPLATFRHPDPPPSANNLYFVRGGRKHLTDAGRTWKNRFKTLRGGLSAGGLMALDLGIHDKLYLDVWIYLTEKDLLVTSFGKSKSAKYPYQKVDTSNFFKLAEDAVTDLLGVACDRQNFKIRGHKRPADHRGRRIVMHLRYDNGGADPYDPG